MCIMADVWPASPTCCRRPSQISESRFSRRLDPSTRLAICGLFVRKLTRPPSRLSLASPSAWKTSCLHSKRIMHGRESCDASPLRSCRNQAPLLICSWYKTVQNSMHLPHPMTSLRALLAYQPQNFELIFSISEVPLFCLAAKWVEGQGCHPSHRARGRPPLMASFVRSALPKTF